MDRRRLRKTRAIGGCIGQRGPYLLGSNLGLGSKGQKPDSTEQQRTFPRNGLLCTAPLWPQLPNFSKTSKCTALKVALCFWGVSWQGRGTGGGVDCPAKQRRHPRILSPVRFQSSVSLEVQCWSTAQPQKPFPLSSVKRRGGGQLQQPPQRPPRVKKSRSPNCCSGLP